MQNYLSLKKIFNNKFLFTKLIIFFIFFLSLFLNHKILEKNDVYTSYNNIEYHKMIKADPHRYLSHGAEIKKEVEEGNNFFLSGRENYTKYLPPRIAALYYITFDRDLFNNFEEKKINIGIHKEYLIIQILLYFFSIFFLFNSVKNRFDNRVVSILICFLCIEPTIVQYNFSFWSESIFFSIQIIIISLIFKKNQSYKNLFFIGLFIAILSLQRQIAFFYIIPIILYYFIFIKKIDKIIFIILGYLSIQLSLGYINYLNTSKFHVITADSKIEIHRSFVSQVISKIRGTTTREFNYSEGIIVKDWLEKNNIEYTNKEKFLLKEFNFFDWMDYRREIVFKDDKISFDNFIRSRSYMYFSQYPFEFIKHYLDKSKHIVILNPFHIYSDLNFVSGEIYYSTKSHEKYINIRILYTLLIYSIALLGLIFLFKKKKNDTVILLLFSLLYFFGLVGWSGNTRYFVPNLIYISFLFSFGLNSIYQSLFRKKT